MDDNNGTNICGNDPSGDAPHEENVQAGDAPREENAQTNDASYNNNTYASETSYGNTAYGSGVTLTMAPSYEKKKGLSGGKLALLVIGIILGIVLISVIGGLIVRSWFGSSDATVAYPESDFIARISVVGEIGATEDPYSSSNESYHHDWTMSQIDQLISDPNNKGILLYIDTPGGTVYESDELYLKLEEYKEATDRPIYVYMGSMAASGGYYIAASADQIHANRNTWTGSIGVVIGTLFDVSGFLEEHKIKATDITTGRNKSMGSMFEPMSEEQRQIFQGLVDEAYLQFVEIVAEGRNMDLDEVKEIADGRIYTAKQAVENGLIDEIGTEENTAKKLAQKTGNEGIQIVNVEYTADSSPFNIMDTFLGLLGHDPRGKGKTATSETVPGDVAAVLELTERGEVPIMYMYRQ
jgi:protease-4